MTKAIETIRLIEGMPDSALPSNILTACRVRHERHRQDKIDVALATANLVLNGFSSSGGDVLTAVGHMFTEDELTEIREEREEQRQVALQRAQVMRMRMMK